MADPVTKRCRKCNRDLALSEFYRFAVKRGHGLSSWCRACTIERSRQYYLANREKILKQQRDNPRQLTPQQRERRDARLREWYRARPGLHAEQDRQWRLKNPLYGTWEQMLKRCEDPRVENFKYYGARGICVCPGWHDYKVFESDIIRLIGPRPEGKTLDRIDNDGNYEPGNVRWATHKEQRANQRPPGQRKRRK